MDELFVLNAGIDYFLLLASAKVCALPFRRRRFALAAALGALWCCLGLLPGCGWMDSGGGKLLPAVGMCLVAFGREEKLWRSFGVFMGLSLMFGGAVWAAGLWRGVWQTDGRLVRLDMRVLLLSFALCWCGVSLVFRRRAKQAQSDIAEIVLRRGTHSLHIRALRDSGNELYDPLTGRHVLTADARALAPLFSPEERAALEKPAPEAVLSLRGFRLVPYASLGGSGLMPCFSPEEIRVDGKKRDDLAVAVSPRALSDGGRYQAIL